MSFDTPKTLLSRLGAKFMERLGADDGPPVEYIHSSEYERRKAEREKAEAERAAKADALKAAERKPTKGGNLVALFTGLFDASKAAGRFFKDARGTVYQYRANGMIVRAIRKNSKEGRRRAMRALCKRYARPGKPTHRIIRDAKAFAANPPFAQPEDRAVA